MAKDAGLDVERLRKDMDAHEIADAIIGNFNLARALRITLTPTFIIGNRMVTELSATLDFGKAVGAARAAKWTAGGRGTVLFHNPEVELDSISSYGALIERWEP